MNILLFIHVVVAILLVITILLQKSGVDSLSGIGGKSEPGLVGARTASNFLTKTTVVLAAIFFVNSIILANLSTGHNKNIAKTIEEPTKEEERIPIK